MQSDLIQVQEDLRKFVSERDWGLYHDPKNLAMLLASEVGELVAELRWVEGGDSDAYLENADSRTRFAQELGDVGIALLLLCQRTKLDLVEVVRAKIEINRKRYPVDSSRGRSDRPV